MSAIDRLAGRLPLFVAAGALWVTAGVLSPAGSHATERIAVLPSVWIAVLLLLAATALALVPWDPARLRPLYLSALLWLPWLPLPIPPAFLLWHGPLAWAVWAVVAGLLLVPVGRAWWPRVLAATPGRQIALAAVIAAVAYVAAAWRMAPLLPGGDEPHYLVITQSLLHDGDLKIENNHRRGDYHAYFGGALKPDYLRRGVDGAIYSIHAPGVSALVLPAFAVGGYRGVVIFLAVLSAWGAALVWRAAFRITGDPAAAWAGWAAVALSAPYCFQAFTVYPDGPAAVLVMTGVYALAFPEVLAGRSWRPVAHGAALALLPWLHTRYAVLAGVLGVEIAWRLIAGGSAARERRGPLRQMRAAPVLSFLLIPVIGAAGWLWSFHAIYGEWNPAAPYGGYTQSSLANAPGGILGLLLDQQFGLLPNAPIYLMSFLGLGALWHTRRRFASEWLLVVFPYVMAVACYHMWWGGHSSPARFVVPVLLPFGLAAAVQWSRGTPPARAVFGVLLAASLALTAALVCVDRGALVYNVRDGVALWMERAAPLVDLPRAMPSLFKNSRAMTVVLAGAWGAAAVVSWFLSRWRAGAGEADATRACGALACTLMIGTSLGWFITEGTPIRGGTGLLRVAAAAAARGRVIRLPWPRVEATGPAFAGVRVPSARPSEVPAGGLLYVARNVPAGQYRIVADGRSALSGTLDLTVGQRVAPLVRATLDHTPPGLLPIRLDLPAGAQVLTIGGDSAAAVSIDRLTLQIDALSDGADARFAHRVVRYGNVAVWFLDEGAFAEPEGWWVGGRAAATVMLDAPRTVTTAALLVRNGGVPNRIALTVGSWSATLDLTPGEERPISVPLVAGRARLMVSSAAGFRPSDVDPGSKDGRVLGVWVQVR